MPGWRRPRPRPASSRTIATGVAASARAIATRCRCPPDSSRGRTRAWRASRPTWSSKSRARRRRASAGSAVWSLSASSRQLPIRCRGSSELYGSWKTICRSRPRLLRSLDLRVGTDRSRPATATVPLDGALESGQNSGDRRLSGPRLPDHAERGLLAATVKLTSSTATKERRVSRSRARPRNDLLSERTTTAASSCRFAARRRRARADGVHGLPVRPWAAGSVGADVSGMEAPHRTLAAGRQRRDRCRHFSSA